MFSFPWRFLLSVVLTVIITVGSSHDSDAMILDSKMSLDPNLYNTSYDIFNRLVFPAYSPRIEEGPNFGSVIGNRQPMYSPTCACRQPAPPLWAVHLHPQDNPKAGILALLHNTWLATAIRMEYEPEEVGVAYYTTLAGACKNAGLILILVTTKTSTSGNLTPTGYASALQPGVRALASYNNVIWEIFNEPDINFPGTIASYEALVVDTASMIHATNSFWGILPGGTSGIDAQNGFRYAIAVGTNPTVKSYTNGTSIHPYGISPGSIGAALNSVSAAVGRQVFVTEWGVAGGATIGQAMQSADYNTPLFVAYDYETESNDGGNFGLATNGQWPQFQAVARGRAQFKGPLRTILP